MNPRYINSTGLISKTWKKTTKGPLCLRIESMLNLVLYLVLLVHIKMAQLIDPPTDKIKLYCSCILK